MVLGLLCRIYIRVVDYVHSIVMGTSLPFCKGRTAGVQTMGRRSVWISASVIWGVPVMTWRAVVALVPLGMYT